MRPTILLGLLALPSLLGLANIVPVNSMPVKTTLDGLMPADLSLCKFVRGEWQTHCNRFVPTVPLYNAWEINQEINTVLDYYETIKIKLIRIFGHLTSE